MTVIAPPKVHRRAPVAMGACLVSFAAFWMTQRAAHVSMIDLMVYRAEGATVRAGGDLYALRTTAARLPTTYPPFAALLFTPLTLLDTAALRTLGTAGNLALLVVFVRLSLRLVGHARVESVWWVAAVAVWCEPVWTTLRYGQINLLLAVLVLWDLSRRPGDRWAGIGIGLAAAVKLTPALFAVFLLVTGLVARHRHGSGGPWLRHARMAAAWFIGATLPTAAVLPYDSWHFWSRMVFAAGRVGHAEDTANQALRGVLARLLHTPEPGAAWILTAAVVGAAGLGVAVAAELRGRRSWAVTSCAVTALLVSPVSWSHHWVWCLPVVLLLGTHAYRAAAVSALLVFSSYALWWVPHGPGRHELRQSGIELTLSALYGTAGCLFLVIAGVAFRDPGPGQDAPKIKP
ncbi:MULTISPECIES: glycosyltransferase 87 family protein [unclassified Streptomyces]|uniref:glycosyltransferase 87 family protein n=1 Tax=unclassified Streptomyces TaxID=2593676 RepID=UPI0023651E1C|nr:MULTISPECIES: glycosyltransferase 87 family protein [unclassified Streptomyces]MDF3143900.1 glycosyltransferase 87 family protein [Streptomyces sp. T21Q-yed]WDF38031.1 glycosyltransferase 87 family protein [Streptomyces sp. T12]